MPPVKAMDVETINAQWSAAAHIRALTTLRSGGTSLPPYDSLNLARHVGDEEQAVKENRARLRRDCTLPAEPVWLEQAHGTNIVRAEQYRGEQMADGSFTDRSDVVCAVLTADCLPLFLCSVSGGRVGLFHVGWRGLVKGMVGKAVEVFQPLGKTIAWLGPTIGPAEFEIGQEVKVAIERSLHPTVDCFQPGREGRWLADLYKLVAHELHQRNVTCVYDAALCTYSDRARFFSYRRSGRCGRMASLIWMES